MGKYILVYDVNEHYEMGGGRFFSSFENEEDLHEEVNKLAASYKELFIIVCAGVLSKIYEYEPVVQTTVYKPKII